MSSLYYNFKYIFPGNKTILYYASCVINRNIKRYLERKKVTIINKLVHTFLDDTIQQAKKNHSKKKHQTKYNVLSTNSTDSTNPTENDSTSLTKFAIGDIVLTELGEGTIEEIRDDGILVLRMNITTHHITKGYFHNNSVSLVYNKNNINNTKKKVHAYGSSEDADNTEDTEEYSEDFEESSEDTVHSNQSYIYNLYGSIKEWLINKFL